MDYEYYEKYVNKNTVGRYDLTPVFSDGVVFSNLISDLTNMFSDKEFDVVVGLDALGFVISSGVALKSGKGLVLVRKGGKLPGVKDSIISKSFVDYTKKEKVFEMNKGSIKKGQKVLIADEWIETGNQVRTAISLIEEQGGIVVGVLSIGGEKTDKTKDLFEKYDIRCLKTF